MEAPLTEVKWQDLLFKVTGSTQATSSGQLAHSVASLVPGIICRLRQA